MTEATPFELPEGLTLNMDKLTMGDICDFEDVTQKSFFVVQKEAQANDGNMALSHVIALLWLEMRRTRPQTTLAEIRSLPMTELQKLSAPQESDPKES